MIGGNSMTAIENKTSNNDPFRSLTSKEYEEFVGVVGNACKEAELASRRVAEAYRRNTQLRPGDMNIPLGIAV